MGTIIPTGILHLLFEEMTNNDYVSGQGEKFCILLTKTTIYELIDAVVEGISLLHLKSTDMDSMTSVQKSKNLLGRCVVKAGRGENYKQVADESLIEKNFSVMFM